MTVESRTRVTLRTHDVSETLARRIMEIVRAADPQLPDGDLSVIVLEDGVHEPTDLVPLTCNESPDNYELAFFVRPGCISVGDLRPSRSRNPACICCRNSWLQLRSWEDVRDEVSPPEGRVWDIVRKIVDLRIQAYLQNRQADDFRSETEVHFNSGVLAHIENHIFVRDNHCGVCSRTNTTVPNATTLLEASTDKKFGWLSATTIYENDGAVRDTPYMCVTRADLFNEALYTCGTGMVRNVAIAKALSESVERCAFMGNPPGDTFEGSYAISDIFDSIEEFLSFGALDESGWSAGERLLCVRTTYANGSRAGRLLPAQLFYPMPNESRYFGCTSSGSAARRDLEMALQDAIEEVVERHVFLTSWHWRHVAGKIVIPPSGAGIVTVLSREGFVAGLYYLGTCLGIHVFMATVEGSSRTTVRFACALGASTSPQVAVDKALCELYQVVRSLNARLKSEQERNRAKQLQRNELSVSSTFDHALKHVLKNPLEADEFKIRDWMELQDVATGATDDRQPPSLFWSTSAPPQVLYVEAASRMAQMLGQSAVKAVVPGFHPFYIGEESIPFRLRDAPNQSPHPLA